MGQFLIGPFDEVGEFEEKADHIHLYSFDHQLLEEYGQEPETHASNPDDKGDHGPDFFGQFHFWENEQSQREDQLPLLEVELEVQVLVHELLGLVVEPEEVLIGLSDHQDEESQS